MFTGIVGETGTVKKVVLKNELLIITINCIHSLEQLKSGDSIAVEGICFTVVKCDQSTFTVEAVSETQGKSTISLLKKGMRVNLELPLKYNARLDGHFVQGHIDCMAEVSNLKNDREDYRFTIKIPGEMSVYTVEKGSVTINGVSLTITEKTINSFGVAIIPHTLQITTLGQLKVGDKVNLEFDILGKYVKNILQYS